MTPTGHRRARPQWGNGRSCRRAEPPRRGRAVGSAASGLLTTPAAPCAAGRKHRANGTRPVCGSGGRAGSGRRVAAHRTRLAHVGRTALGLAGEDHPRLPPRHRSPAPDGVRGPPCRRDRPLPRPGGRRDPGRLGDQSGPHGHRLLPRPAVRRGPVRAGPAGDRHQRARPGRPPVARPAVHLDAGHVRTRSCRGDGARCGGPASYRTPIGWNQGCFAPRSRPEIGHRPAGRSGRGEAGHGATRDASRRR